MPVAAAVTAAAMAAACGGHGHSGGHMSFKGGGGGPGHGHGGKGHGQHYAHGGNWNSNYYSNHHGKYGHYRRYGITPGMASRLRLWRRRLWLALSPGGHHRKRLLVGSLLPVHRLLRSRCSIIWGKPSDGSCLLIDAPGGIRLRMPPRPPSGSQVPVTGHILR